MNTLQGRIPCAIFMKFAEFVGHICVSHENLDGLAEGITELWSC